MKNLRKLAVLTVCWLFTSLSATLYAQTVINLSSPGTLAEKVTNRNVTELTLTGVIDARDVLFMKRDMPNLAKVDLSGVTINAYRGIDGPAAIGVPGDISIGVYSYPANEMPAYSFSTRATILSVILPDGITSIGEYAFWACSGLTSINIPEGVTSIKNDAFSGDLKITSITFPAGLASIGRLAFWGWKFTSITNLNPVPIDINRNVFLHPNIYSHDDMRLGDCELRVLSSSVEAYKKAEVWKEFRITGIGDYTVTVTADKGSATGEGTYDMNASATVEATPETGYKFVNWTNTGDETVVSTGNPYTFTVTEDIELKANFEALVYTITYNLDGGSNHSGNPSTYTIEDAVILQAPSKQGHDFAGWTEGDEIVAGSTGNKTFTAQWEAYSDEANIEYIAVNGRDITESENEGVFEYQQTCGESEMSKTLTLRVSPKASVKLGETPYPPSATALETTLETTNLTITVISQSGKTNIYTLKLTGVIDGALLYILRWNDVLGINSNSDNNGGRIIDNEYTHWYRNNDDTEIGSGDYIEITGAASDYYAVIEIEGEKYRVCHTLTTQATEIKAYPNPVARGGKITLELPESLTGSVLNIYNINGSLVKSGLTMSATINSIDVSEHVPGIYLLRITAKNGNHQTIKIITE